MNIRRNVRAVLSDGDHLLFLRRRWPGGSAYCTTVGGGVADDADLEAALRREVLEETGATIGPLIPLLTETEPGTRLTLVRHYFHADVLHLDPARRGGPELDAPDTGDFTLIRVPRTPEAVRALALDSPALTDLLCEHLQPRPT
ncbi:NUDIX domain-containing protein [Streptomyces sp. NPDC060194]|uniref:NUDIX domain-containing protein n=1 Tax=Streptomyces sp. NPDC060194 TaxID=3347069 RepID=UPI00365CF60C